MRFQLLDLVRYGGFADRVVTFGPGQPDLHLVMGPNEAGKSTMLEAIGDLLFGIHAQTAQGWRFDYGELRIRAVLEHQGGVVEIARRKGSRNTLLATDGTALPEDILVPLLGGIDRTTFERMYGLDHQKLRSGGLAILEGKDDAARLVLEAGSGLSGVGAELARLERIASELFKPNAQIPPVNRLMRERGEAQAIVRSSALTDSAWSAIIAAERRAGEQRSELQVESRKLATRAAALERTNRARAPLARTGEIDAELEALGDIKLFPADAESRLNAAIANRNTAQELQNQHSLQLDRAQNVLSSITLPELLLAERERAEALEERRPVVEKAVADIARRTGELERSEVRIEAARAEARLPAGAALPSAGWRKRAREYLQDRRALAERRVRLHLAESEAALAKASAEADLAALPPAIELAGLTDAIAAVPADFAERITSAEDRLTRAERRMQIERAGLSPWAGEIDGLGTMSLPVDVVVAEHQARIEGAKAELAKVKLAISISTEASTKATARLDSLSAAADLPTPEAVLAARATRDSAVADVRGRLARPREPGDEDAGAALSLAVERADAVADRRDAEADRIAELLLARTTSAEADALHQANRLLFEEAEAALDGAEADWASLLAPLGLVLPPAALAAWRAGRERVLEAFEEQTAAKTGLDRLKATAAAAMTKLVQISAEAGFQIEVEMELADAVRAAKARLSALEAADKLRAAAIAVMAGITTTLDDLAREERDIVSRDTVLDEGRRALIAEAGLFDKAGDPAISDAIEASETVAAEIATADGLRRQINGMKKDIDTFEADANALFTAIGHEASTRHSEDVHALALTLKAALAEQLKVERAREDIVAAQAGIQESEARAAAANAVVAELLGMGDLTEEAALLPAITTSTRSITLSDARQIALNDIVEISGGRSVEDLTADVAAIGADEATAELGSIADRQHEIGAEREAIGRVLRESELAHDSAATGTLAADAEQRVKEIEAALLDAAERHVGAAATAAVLRWLIGKHRAESQGPLIARAGSMFQEMTHGSFSELGLDYGADDQPRMVGLRQGGERVGVDGMSEGTRDQLYLALRLASIDERAAGGMPLICDDILITADEPRSASMLSALGAISKRTQVIVFTHHEHIVDLARRTLADDGFTLHRLDADISVTAAA